MPGRFSGFFDILVDHLYATPVTVNYFRRLRLKNLVVVSPDTGGVERARGFAKRMNIPLAIIDKRREDAHVVEIFNVIGEVEGKTCLLVDDMIDTGGTLVTLSASALMGKGRRQSLCLLATHGVFAGNAIVDICSSPLEQVVATNSIPLSPAAKACGKIKVLSVASLLADAIRSIHDETSVSKLFIASIRSLQRAVSPERKPRVALQLTSAYAQQFRSSNERRGTPALRGVESYESSIDGGSGAARRLRQKRGPANAALGTHPRRGLWRRRPGHPGFR